MYVTLALQAACFPRVTPLKIVGCWRVQQVPALTSLLVQHFERCGIHSQRSHCSLLNEEGIATPNSTSQRPQLNSEETYYNQKSLTKHIKGRRKNRSGGV